jgi:hypothetical protein
MKRLAVARPMPVAPPVITAVFPFSPVMTCIFPWICTEAGKALRELRAELEATAMPSLRVNLTSRRSSVCSPGNIVDINILCHLISVVTVAKGFFVIRSMLFFMSFLAPIDLAPQNVNALGVL